MVEHGLKYIRIAGGTEIAYVEAGTGPRTLLFVHGMDSNRKAWMKNLSVLRRTFRCIALDLPNHGASSKGRFPFTAPFFSQVLVEFSEAMGLNEPVLVGHSMGGQAVLRALLDNPLHFQKAVLVAPAGLERFSQKDVQQLQEMYTVETIRGLTEQQIEKNVQNYFHHVPADAGFMLSERLALRQAPHFDLHCEMIPKCITGMVQYPVYSELQNLQSELLVIYGADDKLIPHPKLHAGESTSTMAKREVGRIPTAQLKLFPETGHFCQWEQPEAFHKAVTEFLAPTNVNPFPSSSKHSK